MQRGGHRGGRPFLGFFCFLRNAGPRKTPFFASCATQGPKKTLFCFLHNAGPEKDPLFASCVVQEAKNVSFPAAERRFTKPEIGFVIPPQIQSDTLPTR